MLKILPNGIFLCQVWGQWYWLRSDNAGSRWSDSVASETLAREQAEQHERSEKLKQEAQKKLKRK